MITIILPSRNEQFLQPTIKDLLDKAEGEIEIIAILDGYWPQPPLEDDKRLRIIHRGKSRGMRDGITSAAKIATGEYLMKLDAHCIVDRGFDTKLKADMKDNWIVIPRRKRLDAENWCIQDVGKPDIDAMYLSYPDNPQDFGGASLSGKLWNKRSVERKDILIDDDMSFQGSCWFMKKDYFFELELMDDVNYGPFWKEAQEIGLKCWLSGGEIKRNKKTWYAHLHKGKKYGRGYFLSKDSINKSADYSQNWLKFGKAWHKQTKPLSWLIEKFMPVPTWDEEKLNKLKESEYEK